MSTKSNTSVNILRDIGKDINYIVTPNALNVAHQIHEDFVKGIRSFNLIGSYGTGKSSFLWALQKSIKGTKKYFNLKSIPNKKVEILNIIGDYQSIIESFGEQLGIKSNKVNPESILSKIFDLYHDLGKGQSLFICIDEFGKFLEFAAKNDPERELYFIQQLAEFVNNTDLNIVLITTVHQNIDGYAFHLNYQQKQEWSKVKGRFREITFNEPIEQLLHLAAEHTKGNVSSKKYKKDIVQSVGLLTKSKMFAVNKDYINEIAEKLFPLDIFSSFVIANALQKYGQNERSLFTFLESTDHVGLVQHLKINDRFYSVADVNDYLVFNYYSYLNSKYNPDFSVWRSIKATIERVETTYNSNIGDYNKLVKTIGLLGIFAQTGADIGKKILVSYAKKYLLVKNPEKLLNDLISSKIILYRNYSKRYILFEGTDLDIQTALIKAEGKVQEVTDVVNLINKDFSFAPILAKKVTYDSGTPRLFEYVISDHPIEEVPNGEIDGFINLIFNDKNIQSQIKKKSAVNDEAVIYCYYKNSVEIKDLLFEIVKTEKVIAENQDDKIAVRELKNIVEHQSNLLSHKILNSLYGDKSETVWIYKGKKIGFKNKRQFNAQLSEICEEVYSKTPIFKNELVNKHKISTSINTARRKYLNALIENWGQAQLGFSKDKFPAEKTIYLSLLESNEIKLFGVESSKVKPSSKNKFDLLWQQSLEFLDSAKFTRRSLNELNDILSQKPFKLKKGFVDFWLPSFLFIKRDDYALFHNNTYIPYISAEIFDLLIKHPNEFEIKSFSLEGVNLDIFNSYRQFLDQNDETKLSNSSFIETIKPFLVFYKDLSFYAQNTSRLSKETQAVRNAIAVSKDPEKTFFEDFPLALGYTISRIQKNKKELQGFITSLKKVIRDIRTAYDDLINRIELFVQNEIVGEDVPFIEYRQLLQERFVNIRRHMLLPEQKVFLQRVDSPLDDKQAWLNSLVQALIGKSADKIKDEEEMLIYDSFNEMILSLDSLVEISTTDFKEDKEEVLDLQLNSFDGGLTKKLIRLPKKKSKQTEKLQKELENILMKDNAINIVALANILKKKLKDD